MDNNSERKTSDEDARKRQHEKIDTQDKTSDKSKKNRRPDSLKLELQPAFQGFVDDEKTDIDAVSDNLLIGSAAAAMDPSIIEQYKVTHVLTVAPLPNYVLPPQVKHKALDMLDLPDTQLTDYMDAAFAFINDAIESKGCVLVHCNAGVSRSAAIIIAYLMKTNHLTYAEAFKFLRQKRPAIDPNLGFIVQLQKYEKQSGPKNDVS